MKFAITVTTLTALLGTAVAQDNKGASVAKPAKDDSVAAELASFEVADGFEVSLFASEENGIANPVAMRWGPRGRLWVLCTLAYPQIFPSSPPSDKLFILEDTNHDGRADKTVVFADNLDMPTGFALGDGGVYVGEGDDLVFLTDTDQDDHADRREVVLSGFGTGDTHQNINSFTWSPGGELLFCQGLHNFARVETPWGIVRMDEHGVWRLRPRRRQLHAFRGGSGQNPWGIAFGQWGEPFVKGNNSELSELLPVMVHTTNRHAPLDIGRTRIKSMICEIVDSPVLPEDLQGDVLIAGYFAHIVDRLEISPDRSGHRGELQPPLFRTNHQSFRPVDIQTGPDGALYVADWYNPIIGHYQASLRHPDRDMIHGRIWRVTARGKPPLKPENLESLSVPALLNLLPTAPLRERERIRIALSNRDEESVLAALATWIGKLDRGDPNYERQLFEALCLLEWREEVDRAVLEKLLVAQNPLARAYATRVVGRWHDRLDIPLALLEASIADSHPRVRLEAVVAASNFDNPRAMELAIRALDRPLDRFLTAALVQCSHALRERWFPALQNGTLGIANPNHLAFLLSRSTGQDAARAARDLLENGSIPPGSAAFAPLAKVLAMQGTVRDLDWLFTRWQKDQHNSTSILAALVDSAKLRNLKPSLPDWQPALAAALDAGNEDTRIHAIELAGRWDLWIAQAKVSNFAVDQKAAVAVRLAAIEALPRLKDADHNPTPTLSKLAAHDPDPKIRHRALRALTTCSLPRAASIAAGLLAHQTEDSEVRPLVLPFLAQTGGDTELASALKILPPNPKRSAAIRAVLGSAGRHSPALEQVLDPKPAQDTIGIPAYDEGFVRDLTAEVKSSGDAKRGSKVYHADALSCTMCHVLDVCGREFGPELTAVGAGLPIELIIEAVVWPKRQVKEGFLATTLTTRNGRIVSGFVQTEDKQKIVIRDAVSGETQTVAPREVATRQDAGTVMPPGLTANLTRAELRDLVRFLSERKGREAAPSAAP